MGKVLQSSVLTEQPPQQIPNPWDVVLERKLRELEEQNRNRQPMYTPEQVTQRRGQNQREYELGLLGVLSGNEAMGNVGGMVLKNALANRQPRITERGVADPITGEFNYDPDYLRQQKLAELDAIQKLKASVDLKRDADARDFWQRQMLLQQRGQQQLAVHVNQGEPLVQTMDANGNPIWTPRSQAAGMPAPPKAAANPTESERNASGFAERMEASTKILDKYEAQGRATDVTVSAGALPMVGARAKRAVMTPEQQQYDQAAADWIRAKLRKESGAAIGVDEMHKEYETYFPMPGETDPAVIAQKRQAREIANRAMRASGGRAMPATPPPGPQQDDDPLNLRGGKPGPRQTTGSW